MSLLATGLILQAVWELLLRSLLIGHRKQWHVILPIVSVLFGARERTIGDFSSEQLLHDPVLQAGLAKPKGLLGGWFPFSLKTLRLTEPLNFKSLNSALPSQIWWNVPPSQLGRCKWWVLELRREMIIILSMLRKISKMINIEFKMYIKAADK